MFDRIVVVGASRGIGAAIAARYVDRTRQLISVSRTPAAVGHWKRCDIADPEAVHELALAIGPDPIDALLVLGGTWEAGAFTEDYSFEHSTASETTHVIAVNLTGPILLVQAMLPQLKLSSNPRVVFIGALSGRDGEATPEVANTASKFGLRGVAQALRIALRNSGVSITVINPANVATAEVEDDIAAGRFEDQTAIPLADLGAAIDCVLAMSPASSIAEIDIVQRYPGSVG